MSDALQSEIEFAVEQPSGPEPGGEPTKTVEVPLGLLAELTHRCPLQCLYCSNPVELERVGGELSTAEWARIFDEAAEIGVVQVHLSGGEPLVRRDIAEIVAAARTSGLYVNLITAAVNLSPARVDTLLRAGLDHVQISLQDATADGITRITRYEGAFERKLEAARLVTERGLPLTINAVVHRQNLDRLNDIITICEGIGAHRLEIAHTQYYGWAYRNRSVLMPEPHQVEAANTIVSAARERLKGILTIDYVVPDYYARYPKPCMGGWGRQFINVTPSGTVLPCHAAAQIPGLSFDTVREKSLGWIWQNSASFNRFRGTAWMPDPCRTCTRRDEDYGGCRCQAFLLSGDAANADPVCTLSPHRDTIARLTAELAAPTSEAFYYRRYS